MLGDKEVVGLLNPDDGSSKETERKKEPEKKRWSAWGL